MYFNATLGALTSKKLSGFSSVGMLGLVLWSGSTMAVTSDSRLTLEKIMSDPSWIANTPQQAKWLPDSRHIVYKQNIQDSAVRSVMRLDTRLATNNVVLSSLSKQVPVDALHTADISQISYPTQQTESIVNQTLATYMFDGDVFIVDINTNKRKQITFTSDRESTPQFLTENRLGYWQGQKYFTYHLKTNTVRELFKLSMSDAPEAPKGPKDLIAKEQHKLIQYVAQQQTKKEQRYEHKANIKANNAAMNKANFYFGTGNVLRNAQVAPDGSKVFVVTSPKSSWRGKDDLMPNYIADDGRIAFEKVRQRVADAKPVQQQFYLVDIDARTKQALTLDAIPDVDKDVLASVKKENAEALGNTYESKPSKRTINLLVDWSWDQSPIRWHDNSQHVALMLEAWDNKDRWLVSIDTDNVKDATFVTQHQLHDEAWINYTFNDFGWLPHSKTLYFLSEESGYSHLYTKDIDTKNQRQLTKGNYEVSELTLSKDGMTMYFRANINHPGEYHIYSLGLSNDSRPENLTETLVGNNTYELSPNEKSLLVTHSSLLVPEELFLVENKSKSVTKLTDTVTAEFKAIDWNAPKIVAVPSSNTEQPIYSRVYLPENYKAGTARKAVVFNHGAGYLQNSHKGWSGYFREFMFHNLLTQQGYVVMDMDYRASKGYGREWRTAIYRQMGTPEIEDLVDGVEWLVENANVDRKRIGTYGGSYGGFMTFMALFNEPDLFQAGAALRPVTDWAHYNDGYTSNILNRPSDDMLAYTKSSPIYYAEGLTKPLLINAPMVDDNVFFVDVVRLVQRLIELEKQNFETAIYPVEPHGFRQPSSWLDEYRRIYKLFEENL